MDKKLYKFGIDWLNGVLPVNDVWSVFEMLEKFSSKLRFDRWELVNSGKYNYSRRYCFEGKASIQLMYNPVSLEEGFTARYPEILEGQEVPEDYNPDATSNNPYVFFSISGDGIRHLADMGGDVSALNKLLFYFFRNNFRASRMDVYCDILDKDNAVVPIISEAFNHFIKFEYGKPTLVTKLHRVDKNCRIYPHYDCNGDAYCNYELGGHGSRFGMFRCYNKLEEILTGRLARYNQEKGFKNPLKQEEYEFTFAQALFKEYGVVDYWYRLEYEMHKENADACFKSVMSQAESENSPLSFEDVFAACLNRVFYIVVHTQQVAANCAVAEAWSDFVEFVGESSIDLAQFVPVPYKELSRARLVSYLKKNASFVYSMLIFLFLNPKFARSIIDDGSKKYENRKKYLSLRDEIGYDDYASERFLSVQFSIAERNLDKWRIGA